MLCAPTDQASLSSPSPTMVIISTTKNPQHFACTQVFAFATLWDCPHPIFSLFLISLLSLSLTHTPRPGYAFSQPTGRPAVHGRHLSLSGFYHPHATPTPPHRSPHSSLPHTHHTWEEERNARLESAPFFTSLLCLFQVTLLLLFAAPPPCVGDPIPR